MKAAIIEQLLGRNGISDDGPKIDPEAAVMRLREWAARYAEAGDGPRFAVGDLVTPIADSPLHGAGEPHYVIETRRVCRADSMPSICTCSRDDMRVLYLSRDNVLPLWVESAQFERWSVGNG
jgi:hypothetical protein